MTATGTDLAPEQLRALAAAVSEEHRGRGPHVYVTPSAISQRIKALETRTGRVLLKRVKPITPTESGEVLLRAARQLDAITADVAAELGAQLGTDAGPQYGATERPPAPVIPVAVNADSLATWLLPALAATSPSVRFDIRRDDETRTAALLRDGSVMAAVTASRTPVPGCTVSRLGAMRDRPCATPTFIMRWFPGGATVEELARAPVVTFDRSDVLQANYLRKRTRRKLDPPRQYIPGSGAFLQAVALGLGWGMVPDLQSGPLHADGTLNVFDPTGAIDVQLYWQQWRVPSGALERVADAARVIVAELLGH